MNKEDTQEIEKRLNKLQIIYRNKVPYGIRDRGGYLFFFTNISKYQGQEARYRREIEQQHRLANFLLDALREEEEVIEPTKECPNCLSPLEDNGACSDVGSNNCQYQA